MKKRAVSLVSGVLLLTALGINKGQASNLSHTTTLPVASTTAQRQTIAQRPSSPGDRSSGTVVSVGDGDTLTLNFNGQNATTRLACIDTAETAAPMGQEAANQLRQILPRGTTITVRYVDTDRYNRLVAEVYLGDRSVNLEMVREGYAVVYDQYLSGCADTEQAYLAAEAEAQQNQRAFWSQSNPVMPWDWRRGVRQAPGATSSPSPTGTPVAIPSPVTPSPRPSAPTATTPGNTSSCDPSYPGICIPPAPPDLDCGDIPYRRFTVRQPDPHRFDSDRDGIGCEG